MTYGLVGTLVAVEGARDELVRHLLDAAAVLEVDDSCIQYVVGVSGESEVTVVELWVDEAAHDASLQRDEVRSIVSSALPVVAGISSQLRIEVLGGKGV